MRADVRLRAVPILAGAGLAIALAGCSQTTYGTGESIGSQTVADFANIAKFSRPQEQIDFKPRPPVVAPPSTAALPVPGSASTGPALASNWPEDPDTQAAKVRTQIASAQANGTPIIIKSTDPTTTAAIDLDDPNNYRTTPEVSAAVRAARAKQAAVPLDANGLPVRQYLSDPPPTYLAGDPAAPPPSPESPVAPQKSRLKWPWQWFQK